MVPDQGMGYLSSIDPYGCCSPRKHSVPYSPYLPFREQDLTISRHRFIGDALEREAENMSQIAQQGTRAQIGALQVAIAVCTLATAFVQLYAAALPDEECRFWFLLNGLAYLGLLTVFFLPRFAPRHHLISFLLMGYALLTIVLWFVLGQPDEITGYMISAMELVLAVLAFYEGCRVLRIRSSHFV
jgi:hypothetical protein